MGVRLAACTTAEFIEAVTDTAAGREQDGQGSGPVMISYLNAWCSNIAARDEEYRALLNDFDCVYADGQAVVWASQLLGAPVPERVNAADFIGEFCRAAAAKGVSLFLLGSETGVAKGAAEAFRKAAPRVSIIGAESGYFESGGESSEQAVILRIREAGPDVLIVGMGVPRQEKWAAAHAAELGAKVIWCTGAMFEYHAEARARAPVWMRKAGLEWLFRLVLEPRRLWRRYIIGNAVFVARVLASRIRR